MRDVIRATAVGAVLSFCLLVEPVAAACPDDSVESGTVCIDKYEASLWYVPPEEKNLIRRIQQGTVKLEHLMAAGAVQLGLASGDLAANGCAFNGNGCVNVYAVSIPEVMPAGSLSWFQAVATARNSLKRLPTAQEWQAAALGTPDGAPCNVGDGINFGAIANTGSEPDCISDVGAFDMVGNIFERVADFGNPIPPTPCVTLAPSFGNDINCFGGPTMMRGGAPVPSGLGGGTSAGVFALRANFDLNFAPFAVGFRGAR